MFSSGFQSFAFQTAGNDNRPTGNGGKQESYVTPYQLLQQQEYREKLIRREKTELEKLESVLAENRRKAELAAKNKLLATERRAIALAKAEAEYLAEINRLLMVRAELMQRIKENESILVILMIMRRRRLRVA